MKKQADHLGDVTHKLNCSEDEEAGIKPLLIEVEKLRQEKLS